MGEKNVRIQKPGEIEEDQQEQTRDLEHDCTALLTKGERHVEAGDEVRRKRRDV